MTLLGQKRRTRREMQEDTRARLLEAAFHIIAEDGMAAATIRGVCDRAGFSQGAFYSNFADKGELLLALATQYMSEAVAVFDRLVDEIRNGSLDENLATIANRLAELGRRPGLARLAIELHLHAPRDPRFAAHFDELKSGYHRNFAHVIEKLAKRYDLHLAMSPLQLSIALHAMWAGTVVQATSEGLPMEDLIVLVFRAAIATAQR